MALIISRGELAEPRSIVRTPDFPRSVVMNSPSPCSSRSRCITVSGRPQSPIVYDSHSQFPQCALKTTKPRPASMSFMVRSTPSYFV